MDVIRVNDYKLIKLIGKGTFGEVYLTSNINNSEIYATKRIEINKDQNKTTSKYLLNEIKIMQALNHPNLIKLHNLYRTNNHFYLILLLIQSQLFLYLQIINLNYFCLQYYRNSIKYYLI